MRFLQFQSVGGASGDMILGALIDLGVLLKDILTGMNGFPLGTFEIQAKAFSSNGLNGTQVRVVTDETGQPHRHLSDIREIVVGSTLPDAVQKGTLSVFERLAQAEAKVHDTTPDKIHFHEVGAADSIIDIVGCCFGLHSLGVEGVSVGPLPIGQGTFECAHGIYPLPAPATAELLVGHTVTQTDEPYELVTPTGAALLTTWKTADVPPEEVRVVKTGYGFGHRELNGRPNVLRAMLSEH